MKSHPSYAVSMFIDNENGEIGNFFEARNKYGIRLTRQQQQQIYQWFNERFLCANNAVNMNLFHIGIIIDWNWKQ